jgi:hypothetical protein
MAAPRDPAEAVQVALLRDATVARRLGLARSLTATTRRLSRRAIRRARPAATEAEVAIAFVELLYGRALAAGYRSYLNAQA